jgi:hypothetical protein
MNTAIFKAIMRPILVASNVQDRAVFASIMAKAYQTSTVGFTGTTFGAKLVKGDTAFLQQCINDALDANFNDKTRGVNRNAYLLMAMGFMGYWASAKFVPIPYAPAMTATVKGAVVKIPGTPDPLGANLFYSFVMGDPDRHLDSITTSLLAFQRTIQGSIDGVNSSGTAVTLPWVSII